MIVTCIQCDGVKQSSEFQRTNYDDVPQNKNVVVLSNEVSPHKDDSHRAALSLREKDDHIPKKKDHHKSIPGI